MGKAVLDQAKGPVCFPDGGRCLLPIGQAATPIIKAGLHQSSYEKYLSTLDFLFSKKDKMLVNL